MTAAHVPADVAAAGAGPGSLPHRAPILVKDTNTQTMLLYMKMHIRCAQEAHMGYSQHCLAHFSAA